MSYSPMSPEELVFPFSEEESNRTSNQTPLSTEGEDRGHERFGAAQRKYNINRSPSYTGD
jgi:hypothetical protein